MSYVLKPGTRAQRLYSWMREQPEGSEFTAGSLAKALGLKDSRELGATVTEMIAQGCVARRKDPKHRNFYFYRIGAEEAATPMTRREYLAANSAYDDDDADLHPFVHKRAAATIADLPRLPTIFDMGARK